MENITLKTEILNQYIPFLQKTDIGNSISDKIKISLSIGLFMTKTISLERASQLADMSITDFVNMLINKNIYWHNYDIEGFDLDNEAIKKYLFLSEND